MFHAFHWPSMHLIPNGYPMTLCCYFIKKYKLTLLTQLFYQDFFFFHITGQDVSFKFLQCSRGGKQHTRFHTRTWWNGSIGMEITWLIWFWPSQPRGSEPNWMALLRFSEPNKGNIFRTSGGFPRSADAVVTVRTAHQRPPQRVNVFVFALSCPSVFALEVDKAPLATEKKKLFNRKGWIICVAYGPS